MFPPRALHSKIKTADTTEQRTWPRERVLDCLEWLEWLVSSATSALRKLTGKSWTIITDKEGRRGGAIRMEQGSETRRHVWLVLRVEDPL